MASFRIDMLEQLEVILFLRQTFQFITVHVLSTLQAADSKREEFRKYLEKAGVLDALTKGTHNSWVQK